ncbi:hypothetical protein BDP81DRAFT_450702 [Colletotrichum phormii]|uniref:Uncharacterized protein n=1 Tax=Colletotrichum phormii TaxID=359342 RepID=A0AAI9ZRV2_9PEZI|nr:uncharacterized protein BDP81DRAFT_450702 [Colletotrichum phormii]KAK1635868.1 hypothetical protein BDP81DRAFT_450702 [Colletotrichum phormii]
MAPKTATAEAASTLNLTDGELKLALAMMKHVERPTTAVLEKMTEEAGLSSASSPAPPLQRLLSSASSARTLFTRAATKHGWFTGGTAAGIAGSGTENGTASTTTPRPKKTATPRKKKIAEEEEGAEEAAAAVATAAAAADQEDEDMKEDSDGATKEEAGAVEGGKEKDADEEKDGSQATLGTSSCSLDSAGEMDG